MKENASHLQDDNPLLSIADVARICGRARQTIYFAVVRETLPSELIAGRYLIRNSDAIEYKRTLEEREARATSRRGPGSHVVAGV